ncbi:RBBP9/YdeN family alpha/beta hydrolase [Candidatus Nanohalobium constans]|uniref:Putative esterase of the alpha/beta hydrolase fold n=1 Tax=Candidatus Nanohalobium constans TaxID=2565781 RepID=A0A5Q0UF05_9ARCH|nr:alpha/beta hydrolase [Candidatus Nanohalobium constans]QGA80074.1 putative esterase of the alpha/beta hydrolase fold [Candidatus Nanohalobium constans]
MEKAFIFHGTGASRDDHWFPWLEEKLEEKGVEVCRPDFPTPEGQELENWLEVLDKQEIEIDKDTVLIGHSLGAVFILNILNRRDLDIEAAHLVSAWTGLLPNEQFNEWNSTFQDADFDFEKIKRSIGEIHQFHSASDPYVPLEKAEELAVNLESNLHLKADAGHFNTDSGYTEFPDLWKMIEEK